MTLRTLGAVLATLGGLFAITGSMPPASSQGFVLGAILISAMGAGMFAIEEVRNG